MPHITAPMQHIKEFIATHKKPLIVVLGPTASGKTALSLKIAHEIGGEIISADSRQLYRGMEIATDALSHHEQEGIPHHMIGIAHPQEIITLADYTDQVKKIIEEIFQRGHVPMLVGGTGLYISALIENYEMPRIPPNPALRTKLAQDAQKLGALHLHKTLQKLAPKAAETIHPHNLRYVIRALEVAHSAPAEKTAPSPQPYDPMCIGIQWPRPELYARIEERVERQRERGLVQEVEALLKKGYPPELPALTSLGVKEIIPYLKGNADLESCIATLKQNTRRYAKRQMTWFRRYDNVLWLTPPL